MISGLLGQKLGMTRLWTEDNGFVAVTVVQAGPCKVIQVKTPETDGYSAVQLGFGRKKMRNITKPLLGHLRKHGLINYYPMKIKEFRVENPHEYKPGDEINSSIFQLNELVDVQGTTKGKGFAGVVKRWGFAGGPRTHGQSDRLRAPGSIGSQRPQRVLKGKKMPGHLGAETVTIKNLQILRIDQEKNLLFIKGAIPGNKNSIVVIKKTGKIAKPVAQQVKPEDKKKTK